MGLSCPASCTCKVASGLPDLKTKGKSSVEYQPEGTGCERGPYAPQISAKGHLRLKRRGFGGDEAQGSGLQAWSGQGAGRGAHLSAPPRGRPAPPRAGTAWAGTRGGRARRLALQVQFSRAWGPRWPRRSGPSPICPCRVSAPCPLDASEPQNPGNRGRDSASVPHGSPLACVHPVHALLLSAAGRGARVLLGDVS